MQSDESVMQDKHVSSLKRREIKTNWSKNILHVAPKARMKNQISLVREKTCVLCWLIKNGIWRNIDKDL